jgi:hypothetical protein
MSAEDFAAIYAIYSEECAVAGVTPLAQDLVADILAALMAMPEASQLQ